VLTLRNSWVTSRSNLLAKVVGILEWSIDAGFEGAHTEMSHVTRLCISLYTHHCLMRLRGRDRTTPTLSLRMALALMLLIGVTACGRIAPATPPAQLSHTPGPPVTIADGTYTSIAFTVDYPGGWRVVTSPAFSLPWTVFASPADDAVIVVAVDPDDTDVTPANAIDPITRLEDTITLPENTITVALITSNTQIETFRPIFEAVVASMR